MRWVDLREEFGQILARLRQVWIEDLHWRDCLAKYDSPETFFYIDPPYRCQGSKAYACTFTDADHRELAAALLSVRGKWLLSYNDDPWLAALYARKGLHIERIGVTYTISSARPQRVRELLIRNFR